MSFTVNHLYQFGAFLVDVDQRVILRGGKPIPLTPKVFDTLLVLIEHRGRIVEKEELMNLLWADSFVEESNLTFNIRQLRKALGDDAHKPLFIETVARRGYRFKAEVKEVSAEECLETATEIHPDASFENGSEVNEGSEAETGAKGSVEARFEIPILEKEVAATKPVALASLAKTERRNFLIVAALSIVLLLSAGAAAWKYKGANRDRGGVLSAFAHGEPNALPVLRYEQLTFNGSTRDAAISPDGDYIAYTHESDRHQSLWLRRLATSENIQLIAPADADYGHLVFSRDGTHVFYVTTEGDNLKAIYRISTFGGAPTRLIRNVKDSFGLSPDESRIAFARRNMSAGAETLFIANLDGTGERELIRRERPERIDFPTWSPDGERIVCVTGQTETSLPSMSMIEIDVASGAEKVLLKPDWFNIGFIRWLPDGRSLLVRVSPKLGSTSQLWLVSYPEGQARKLTDDLNNYLAFSLSHDASRIVAIQTKRSAHIWVSSNERGSAARQVVEGDEFAWTPDGHIVYSSTVGGNHDIWIMRADGTEQRQLTVNPSFDYYPAVSPNNRYIIFSSDRTGTHHLWRMNMDGSDQVQLTYGFGEKTATVSPDSRWVFYNTVDRQTLWKIPIEGGEPAKITDDYAYRPAITPDGKFVAYFQFSPETDERLIAVRALDNSQATRTFKLAPGKWASSSLEWDADAVIYARQSEGQVKLYRQALDAGPPQQMASFASEDDFTFSWSPEGKQFAFARGNWQHDAVLIRVSK